MSKLTKEAKKLLDAIEFEPATLSNNKGRIICASFNRGTKKDKLQDGRYSPKIIKPQMKYSEIIREALEPEIEYDDWLEFRDGFRDFGMRNHTKIYKNINPNRFWDEEAYFKLKQLNAKLKKHERIRRLRLAKERVREIRQKKKLF